MFVVERDGALNGGVREGVAVREVFGYDAGAGLVFLGKVRGIVRGGGGGSGGSAKVGQIGGAGNSYLGRAELGVVEEEGGFCGTEKGQQNSLLCCEDELEFVWRRLFLRFFLKGHGCALRAVCCI